MIAVCVANVGRCLTCMQIAELNASIRYLGGMADFFKEQMRDGIYVNHAEMRKMKLKLDRERDGNA